MKWMYDTHVFIMTRYFDAWLFNMFMSNLQDFRKIFLKNEKLKTKRVVSLDLTSRHVAENVITVCMMMVQKNSIQVSFLRFRKLKGQTASSQKPFLDEILDTSFPLC